MTGRRRYEVKSIIILFCVLILLALSANNVQAMINRGIFGSALGNSVGGVRSDSIKMEISYGMDGFIRPNNKFPINIKLTNQGPDFEGTITVKTATQNMVDSAMVYVVNSLLPDSFEETQNQVITREIPVMVKSGETLRRSLYSISRYNTYKYEITLMDMEGEVVGEEELNIDTSNLLSVEYLVGVMTDNIEYNQILSGFIWPYEQILDRSSVKSLLLQPEDLTVENLNTNLPDVLIFADYQITDLTVNQQVALKTWEEQGGILIEDADTQNIIERLEDKLLKANVNKISERCAMGNSAYDYTSYEMTENMPIREQPNVVAYGIILGVYALGVGPGLYLLLRKQKKRYYLWGSMMALSVLFVIIIGAFGSGTRIRAPFLTYINVTEQSKDTLSEVIDFGLQAPYNSSYSLYVDPSYSLVPWTSENSTDPQSYVHTSSFGQVHISYQEDKRKITVSNNPPFTMTRYSMSREQTLEENKGVSADISVFNGKANGTVTNHTEYDLKNVVVMMPMTGVWIGNVSAGEAVEVKDKQLDYRDEMVGTDYLMSKQGNKIPKEQILENQVWEGMIGMRYITRRSESLVMAQIENPDTSWQMNSGYEAHGNSFYFAPAKVQMEQEDLLYCPYVSQYRSDENIPYTPGLAFYFSYMSDNEYTATYHLDDILEESEETNLQIESLWFQQKDKFDKYTIPFSGEIDFYNYRIEEFEQLKDWKQHFSSEELKDYLNDENELTIRYRSEVRDLDENKVCVLPFIHVTGKVGEDAEN